MWQTFAINFEKLAKSDSSVDTEECYSHAFH